MKKQNHTEDLSVIRNLMEQSTKFMSLSGLSGVFIGIYALIGATIAYYYLNAKDLYADFEKVRQIKFLYFFAVDAGLVLVLSLLTTFLLSKRKAQKSKVGFWNKSAKLLISNLAIPLMVGGAFIGVLYYHNLLGLIAPTTLIFYGLALMQASQHTIKDIKFLGVLEIILGLIACFNIGYGLFFWAFGFGILHILYGIIIYYKYDKK